MDIQKHLHTLEVEIRELKEQLEELGIKNKETPQDWIPTPSDPATAEADPNDLGDRSEDWQERRGTLDALETRYNNLKRAVEKINNESFGKCEICQQPIEEDRLSVNPAARTCKAHLEEGSNLTS